jgi:hypothetical protein
VEHDTIAAIEFEPTARATWFATARQNVWGAVSRAARTPSRIERAVLLDYPVAAGPNGEANGLFGTLTPVAAEPDWVAEYWAVKSDLEAPGVPGVSIPLARRRP